jgi:hypothetical protein
VGRRISSRLPPVSVLLLVTCGWTVAADQGAQPGDGSYPVVKYTETAAEPVVEYNLLHHMLAEPDPQPLLRIYGDGRVHVHYPAYTKRAGDYELQLSQPELRTLLRDLSRDGVIDFDRAAMRSQRQELEAQRRAATGRLFHVSDSSDTVIHVRLEEYQREPGMPRVLKLEKRFVWPDLPQDARRFPQLAEITNANQAAQRLEMLLHRADLVRIPR